jgi:Uma2 family endonuclease
MNVLLKRPEAPPGVKFGVNPSFTIPASAFTFDGFRAWAVSDDYPETGRVEYIGREIFVDMTQERIDTHVLVKAETIRVLSGLVRRAKLGLFFPDNTLLSNPSADVSNVPDSMFASYERFESGEVTLTPLTDGTGSKEVFGTPDWVLEIVSNSSVHKDGTVLPERYHRAGIPEFWLVDARGEAIDFRILRRVPDGYAEVEETRGGWRRSEVFDRRFRLSRERDRIGQWQYTLQVKR